MDSAAKHPAVRLERIDRPGLRGTTIIHPTHQEHFLSVVPLPNDSSAAMFLRLGDCLRERSASIVAQDSFGVAWEDGAALEPLHDALEGVSWPVTWLEPGDEQPGFLSGSVVWAVSGTAVEPLRLDGKLVGMIWEDDHARYCRLGGLIPDDLEAPRPAQARAVLEKMERALQSIGWDFHRVARTWFHNHKILSWYDEFNRTRDDFFRERGVFDRLVPASTGVGGINPAGAELVAAGFALEPKSEAVSIRALPSPLQCPALEYGSSFARAVEVTRPGVNWILVSGTASIEPEGPTAHVGDIDGQIDLTMEVVKAIFGQRGMGWADVSRSIGYFKNPPFAPALDRYASARGLPPMPIVPSHSTVCRDDLLFEIEMDAIKLT